MAKIRRLQEMRAAAVLSLVIFIIIACCDNLTQAAVSSTEPGKSAAKAEPSLEPGKSAAMPEPSLEPGKSAAKAEPSLEPGRSAAMPELPPPGSEDGASAEASVSAGDTRIVYHTPAGYVPTSGDPISIRKVVTPVEGGKNIGNRLRIEVEIIKRDRKNNEIEDLEIFEFVDDSLNLVLPDDNLREGPLINSAKLSSLEEIGEVKDNLSRSDPFASQETDIREKITIPEMEEGVVPHRPKIIRHYPAFNWSNLSASNSSDRYNFMNFLRQDFDVNWADSDDPESVIINSTHPKATDEKNKEIIYINSTKDYNDWVQLQIDDELEYGERAVLTISDRTCYDLKVINTTKGRWLYDWSGILRLHVNDLSSKDRLFYWYYVKPKKSGVFNTESIARITDEAYAGWPDIIYPLDIEVYEPALKFEVVPMMETSRVYAEKWWYSWLWLFKDKLDLKYIIKFTGTAPSSYIDNISIRLDSPTEDCRYLDDKGEPAENLVTRLDFSQNKCIPLNRSIAYAKSDTYPIPGVWIEDELYTFEKSMITVDDPIKRNKDIILFYTSIIVFLLGIVFNKELKKALKSYSNRLFKAEGNAQEVKYLDAKAQEEAVENITKLMKAWSSYAISQKENISNLEKRIDELEASQEKK